MAKEKLQGIIQAFSVPRFHPDELSYNVPLDADNCNALCGYIRENLYKIAATEDVNEMFWFHTNIMKAVFKLIGGVLGGEWGEFMQMGSRE